LAVVKHQNISGNWRMVFPRAASVNKISRANENFSLNEINWSKNYARSVFIP
jgi:hypothetical protein